MKSKFSALALAAALFGAASAQAQTEIQWWHSMGGASANGSTTWPRTSTRARRTTAVVPTFKGSYDESMTAAIAAFRAGNAPHILQVFEVGTATMMAAKGAVVPVGKVMTDAGLKFDQGAYVPAVAGYYTAPSGQMLSFPFNSFHAGAALQQGRLQGRRPGSRDAAQDLAGSRARGRQAQGLRPQVPFTTSWISWTQLESFSAWHNVLFATKNNGFGGLDTRLVFNSPLHVRHIENLANMAKSGLLVYKGRGNAGRRDLRVGRVRHDDRLVGAVRQRHAQRQVRLRHRHPALLP
jgi:sn-glycerol 3-phosphate transport system substrate-binding protein